ncbi:hypothetical protein GCM10011487_47700 [Steroidobacter agaridevorans]|uniref:Lipoprotein n=1 Tax=Steroidobacter agaridevorans TaxID=2695856 RepID=A0A829YHQ5_9GAMM|nr:hypothetical protein [Steroidobacter agaridevorans]GFE82770.1 hypothetical protein GCM10011487_47700 [Steroidobacter agaridevorans]
MFEWIRPRFMLVLIATLGACTKPEDPSDRTARETQRNLELSQIRLDPARCPGGGDGMLYVALGELVMRVPNFSAPGLRGPVYSGAEKLPRPPMPDAPEGCKQHPARAQVLHLSLLVAQSPDHIAAPLRAIGVYRSDGRAHMQEVNEGAFDRARARSDCMTSPSGLTICGRREEGLRVATGMQVAGGNVAGGPRWVAACGFGSGSILVDDCTVYYRLRKHMLVKYLFNQQQVSLERMFELDPAIRDWLNSLVVENYPWPGPSMSKQTSSKER